MQYWLLKSEPDTYSIETLKRDKRTEWSGVRNYQARNFMQSMQLGDLAFFYHSTTPPIGIAGMCKVVREAYPDYTALDPKSEYFDQRASPQKPIWHMVDVAFVKAFKRIITLDELRTIAGLEEMHVLRKGQRLSVQPVTTSQWEKIIGLSGL